jgi:peptidoglycan/LPS O-acetylase OafA/YrhL
MTNERLRKNDIDGQPQSRPAPNRLPALDGLRGIAVLLVIVFHHSLFGAGWIGVQLFFVISGFLITGNMLRDKGLAARPFFGGFYRRRAARIFPVYFAYLALLAVLSGATSKASEFRAYWPYLVTYTYNLAHLRSDFVFSFWFGHFWSLCIEEQFYLVWPLVVYVLSPKHLRVAVIAMIVAAPASRAFAEIVLARHLPDAPAVGDAVYWFTPSHMDGFAFGAAIAVYRATEWLRRPVEWLYAAVAATAVLGLGNLWLIERSGQMPAGENWTSLGYPIGGIANGQHVWSYTVLNLTCALLVFCAAQGKLAWLNRPWLAYVGRISYGAYVVHRAVILLVRRGLERFHYEGSVGDRMLLLAISLPITLTVAACSYRWFEQRFLGLVSHRPKARPRTQSRALVLWSLGLRVPSDSTPSDSAIRLDRSEPSL